VQYRTIGTTPMPFWEAIKEFPTSCGEVGWGAVRHIQLLLAEFRRRGWPVLYPQVAPKQASDGGRLAAKVPAITTIAERGYDFVAEIAPQPGDVLIPKKHPSAFFATPLVSHLLDLQADTLVVTGCTTSGCVRGSVVDAFAHVHFGFGEKITEYTTETVYAAQGGFTTILGYFLNNEAYDAVYTRETSHARSRCQIDFGFHFSTANELHREELPRYVAEFGVTSFKYFVRAAYFAEQLGARHLHPARVLAPDDRGGAPHVRSGECSAASSAARASEGSTPAGSGRARSPARQFLPPALEQRQA
jgi:hypothetical protein